MAGRLLDVRKFLETPKITHNKLGDDPETIVELMQKSADPGEYSYYKFDSLCSDGSIHNVLNQFHSWLIRNPRFFTKVTFDKHTSIYFQNKPKLISKYLYGTTELFYVIYQFNDIEHASDLSRQYLRTQGINALNALGIEALKEILLFKEFMETNEQDSFLKPAF